MLRYVLLLIISELCKKAVLGCVEGWGVTGWVKGVKKKNRPGGDPLIYVVHDLILCGFLVGDHAADFELRRHVFFPISQKLCIFAA